MKIIVKILIASALAAIIYFATKESPAASPKKIHYDKTFVSYATMNKSDNNITICNDYDTTRVVWFESEEGGFMEVSRKDLSVYYKILGLDHANSSALYVRDGADTVVFYRQIISDKDLIYIIKKESVILLSQDNECSKLR